MAKTKISLRIRYIPFFTQQRICDLFCLPKTLTCGKYDQTRFWSDCASSPYAHNFNMDFVPVKPKATGLPNGRSCTTRMDVHCYRIDYLQQRQKLQSRTNKLRVTHTAIDNMHITFILNYPLKSKATRIHIAGLVKFPCEYIVPTSNTSNNVENSRARPPT